MGSWHSTNTQQPPNRSLALVLYDDMKAKEAIQHTNSDFVYPNSLVSNLLPGDIIQKKGNWILQWFYSHFAIYIGNGEIVHVTVPIATWPWNPWMRGKSVISRVVMVNEFGGELVRKNNHLDNAVGFNIQTPPQIVITARNMVGQSWDYDIFTNNCEHFATLCRYGRPVSLQTLAFFDVVSGNITLGEFVEHSIYSIKEKWNTFWSWLTRKIMGIGNVSYPAIQR